METVIGVFDQQFAEKALQRLYDNGFKQEALRLVDRERVLEGPTMEIFGGAPIVAPANTGSTTTPPAVPPIGVVRPIANTENPDQPAVVPPAFSPEFLGLSESDTSEAFVFYRRAVERGASLIIVRATPELAAMARRIMRNSHAWNVSEPPQQAAASV